MSVAVPNIDDWKVSFVVEKHSQFHHTHLDVVAADCAEAWIAFTA